jgi:hypothetical protein
MGCMRGAVPRLCGHACTLQFAWRVRECSVVSSYSFESYVGYIIQRGIQIEVEIEAETWEHVRITRGRMMDDTYYIFDPKNISS